MTYKEREPRKLVTLEVHLKDFSMRSTSDESSMNLSRGGAFIRMDAPYPEGTLIKYEIKVPDKDTISGAARVVWVREKPSEENDPPGVGIKFVKMSPESESLLDEVLAGGVVELVAVPDKPAKEEPEDKPDREAPAESPPDEPRKESPSPEEESSVEKIGQDSDNSAGKISSKTEPRDSPKEPKTEKKEEKRDSGDEVPSKKGIDQAKKESQKRSSPLIWIIGAAILAAVIWRLARSGSGEETRDQSNIETEPAAPAQTGADKEEQPIPKPEETPSPASPRQPQELPSEPAAAEEPPAQESAAPEEPPAEEPTAQEQATPEPEAESAAATGRTEEAVTAPAAETTRLIVDTSPKGATILIDGVAQAGVTPMKLQVEKGKTIEITAKLPGFLTHEESFTAKQKNDKLAIGLDAARIKFKINSKPDGTRILIDGKWNGNTPRTFLRRKYKPEFTFKLEKRGYQSIEGIVTEKDWFEQGRYYIFTFDEPLQPK
jgi:uncharacterized protein (TIGR02266 family)